MHERTDILSLVYPDDSEYSSSARQVPTMGNSLRRALRQGEDPIASCHWSGRIDYNQEVPTWWSVWVWNLMSNNGRWRY